MPEPRAKSAGLGAIGEIARALGSTLDLDELLDLVMKNTTALLGADRSTLFLVDERKGEIWSKVAQGSTLQEIRLPLGTGMAGWVAQTGQTLRVPDAYDDPRFNPEIDRRTGFRTGAVLCMPLRNKAGSVMGVIQVLNKEGGFDAADEKLLEAVAAQAALALENAQLYRAVVSQKAELDVLYDVERRISQSLDLPSLLDNILDRAMVLCEAEAGSVLLVEEATGELYFKAALGTRGDEVKKFRLAPGQGIAGRVAQTQVPHISNDPERDPEWESRIAGRLEMSTRSVICVPIVHEGESIGALELINKRGSGFGEGDLRILTLVAGQAARAIQLGRGREEKQRAERLRAVGRMIASVLHDLKTPMTIISGYAQLMVGERGENERRTAADAIWRQLETVNGMTREVLQFARGERELLARKVLLNQFLADLEEQLTREISGTDVELKVQAGYRGAARFDEAKVQRILHNLVRNAVEAMPDGGKLTLGVDREQDDLVLRVADTGPGIPEEIREHLFEAFVTSGKPGGTGLGLAIVKKLVDDHGGSVECRSLAGKGTTFVVRLPQPPASAT